MEVQERKELEQANMFGTGTPSTGLARYFTGNSYLDLLTKPGESLVFLANATLEPSCRNDWHTHHVDEGGGQILACTAGNGWCQEEGKDTASPEPEMVITIPAGVKHRHDAKADSWFSYITVEAPGTNTGNEWCELVTGREYEKLPQSVFLERKGDLYEFICL